MSFNLIKNTQHNVFIPGQETFTSVTSDQFLDHATSVFLSIFAEFSEIPIEKEEELKRRVCKKIESSLIPATALLITSNNSLETTSIPQSNVSSLKYAFPANLKTDAGLIVTETENIKLLSNSDYMLEAIKVNVNVVNYVGKSLRHSPSFITALLKHDSSIFKHIKGWINNELAECIVESVVTKITSIDLPDPDEKDLWIKARENLIKLCKIRAKLLKSYKFYICWTVLNASDYQKVVKACGDEDWDDLCELIAGDREFYKFVPKYLYAAFDFGIKVISANFAAFKYAPSHLRYKQEFVDQFVQIFKSKQIGKLNRQNLNEDAFLKIFKDCLEFKEDYLLNSDLNWFTDIMQSENVINQKEWLKKAICIEPRVACHISERWLNDATFIIDCFIEVWKTIDKPKIDLIPVHFWSNQEFIILLLTKINNNGDRIWFFGNIDCSLMSNETFLFELVKMDYTILDLLETQTKNKNFMLQMLKIAPKAKMFIHEDLEDDIDIIAQINANEELGGMIPKKAFESNSESDNESGEDEIEYVQLSSEGE